MAAIAKSGLEIKAKPVMAPAMSPVDRQAIDARSPMITTTKTEPDKHYGHDAEAQRYLRQCWTQLDRHIHETRWHLASLRCGEMTRPRVDRATGSRLIGSRYGNYGPPARLARRALRQTPEVPHKVQPVEDCLVLVPRVRPPIAIEPIRVPRKSELDEFFYRNGCSWLASTQPSRNVLLRPEEIHRCSGE